MTAKRKRRDENTDCRSRSCGYPKLPSLSGALPMWRGSHGYCRISLRHDLGQGQSRNQLQAGPGFLTRIFRSVTTTKQLAQPLMSSRFKEFCCPSNQVPARLPALATLVSKCWPYIHRRGWICDSQSAAVGIRPRSSFTCCSPTYRTGTCVPSLFRIATPNTLSAR